MRRSRAALPAALLGSALLGLACAPGAGPAPEIDATPIQIVSPARPLDQTVGVRPGSFVNSHVDPEGMRNEFSEVLQSARVFKAVGESVIGPDGKPLLELRLAASDYGEPDAYTLELQVALVRGNELLTTYFSKQSVRQKASRRQLNVGPEELAKLAQRAVRDLVRQLAADTERIARL